MTTNPLDAAREWCDEQRNRAAAVAANPRYATDEPGVPLVIQCIGPEFLAMLGCASTLIDAVENCECDGTGELREMFGTLHAPPKVVGPCPTCAPWRVALENLTKGGE